MYLLYFIFGMLKDKLFIFAFNSVEKLFSFVRFSDVCQDASIGSESVYAICYTRSRYPIITLEGYQC